MKRTGKKFGYCGLKYWTPHLGAVVSNLTKDETFGGYIDAHHCPPAFLGSDGASYTAELLVDDDPAENGQFGAAVLFIRWTKANPQPDGHLETGYLASGATQRQATVEIENLTLRKLKEYLDQLIENRKERPDW